MSVEALQQIDSILLRELLKQVGSTAPDIELLDPYATAPSVQKGAVTGNLIAATVATSVTPAGEAQGGVVIEGKFLAAAIPQELKAGDKILARLVDDGEAQLLKIVSVNPTNALKEAALATLDSPTDDLLKFFEDFKDKLPVLRQALDRAAVAPRTDLLKLPKLDLNLESLKPVTNLLSSLGSLSNAKDAAVTADSLVQLAKLIDSTNSKETISSLGRLVDIFSLLSSVETNSGIAKESLNSLVSSLSSIIESPRLDPIRVRESLTAAESKQVLSSLINSLEQAKAELETFQDSTSADTAKFFENIIRSAKEVRALPLEDKQVQKVLSESFAKIVLRFGTAQIPEQPLTELLPAIPQPVIALDIKSNKEFSASYQLVIQKLVEQMTSALSSVEEARGISLPGQPASLPVTTKGLLQTLTQINSAFASRSPKAEEQLLDFVDGLRQSLKTLPAFSSSENLSSIATKALADLKDTLASLSTNRTTALSVTLSPEVSNKLQQLELQLKALASPSQASPSSSSLVATPTSGKSGASGVSEFDSPPRQAQSSANSVASLLTLLGGIGEKLGENKPETAAGIQGRAFTQFVKDHMESLIGKELQLRQLLSTSSSVDTTSLGKDSTAQVQPQALETLIKSLDSLESSLKDSLVIKKQLVALTKGLEQTLSSFPPEQTPDEESLKKLAEFSVRIEEVTRKLDLPTRGSTEGSQNLKEVFNRLKDQLQSFIDKKTPLAQIIQLTETADKLASEDVTKVKSEQLVAVRDVKTLMGFITEGTSDLKIKELLTASLNRIQQAFGKFSSDPVQPKPQTQNQLPGQLPAQLPPPKHIEAPTFDLGADQPRAVQAAIKSVTAQIRTLILDTTGSAIPTPKPVSPEPRPAPTPLAPVTGAPVLAVPSLDELLASFDALKTISSGLPQALSAKLEAFIKTSELSFQQLFESKSGDQLLPAKTLLGVKAVIEELRTVSKGIEDEHSALKANRASLSDSAASNASADVMKKVTDSLKSLDVKLKSVGADIIDKGLLQSDSARFSDLSSNFAEGMSDKLVFSSAFSGPFSPLSSAPSNLTTSALGREKLAAALSHEQTLSSLTQLLKRIESGAERGGSSEQLLGETARKLLSQIEKSGAGLKSAVIDNERLQSSLNDLTSRFGSSSGSEVSQLSQNLAALKSLGNLIRGQEFINQLNPVMQAAGEPAFMLFPHLVQGMLSKLEMSFFPAGIPNSENSSKRSESRAEKNKESESTDHDANAEDKRDGKREPFRRISFNVTLPGAGAVQVDFAHSLNELLLNITVEDQGFAELIQDNFFELEKALVVMGYSKCQLSATKGIVQSVRPEWLENCLQLPTLIA